MNSDRSLCTVTVFTNFWNVCRFSMKKMTLHAILEGEKCSEEKMDWNVPMQCRIFPECSVDDSRCS